MKQTHDNKQFKIPTVNSKWDPGKNQPTKTARSSIITQISTNNKRRKKFRKILEKYFLGTTPKKCASQKLKASKQEIIALTLDIKAQEICIQFINEL